MNLQDIGELEKLESLRGLIEISIISNPVSIVSLYILQMLEWEGTLFILDLGLTFLKAGVKVFRPVTDFRL